MASRNGSLRSSLVTFGVTISLLIPVATFLLLQKSKEAIASYEKVSDGVLPTTRNLGSLLYKFRQIRIPVRSMSLQGNSPAEVDSYVEQTQKAAGEFIAQLDNIKKQSSFTAEERQMLERLDRSWAEFLALGGELLELGGKRPAGWSEKHARLVREVCPVKAAAVEEEILALNESQLRTSVVATETARAATKAMITQAIVISLACVLISGALAIYLSSRLGRRFRVIADTISESASAVDRATTQLNGSSVDLAGATSQSASSIQETVASLEELTAMVKQNADHAHQALSISGDCQSAAVETEAATGKLSQAMGSLKDSSRKIEDIIDLIDDIAFQTNLLALNAAVEAARAGEQGRGFSVVAEAVRTLAGRSSEAAKDISGLIKESVERTEQGAKLAVESQTSLTELIAKIRNLSHLTGEIASANKEASSGIVQINQAMQQIDRATQTSSELAERTKRTSSDLSTQIDRFNEASRELEGLVGGVAISQVSHPRVSRGLSDGREDRKAA